jgi:hypothetical protein
MGAAARVHVNATFGLDRLIDDIDRLYRQVIGERGRSLGKRARDSGGGVWSNARA